LQFRATFDNIKNVGELLESRQGETAGGWFGEDFVGRAALTNGKNKLNPKEKQEMRAALLARRVVLCGDVDHMQDNTLSQPMAAASGDLSTVPYHMADVGTDNFEREFTLGLIENEEEELREIDAALERLEKSAFGICEVCGKPIPKSRLKIIPYAKLCIECKKGEEHVKTP